ncbi:MAG: hypothetical protein WC004_01225 [Candidatus Absconditabacterales bacterium]
MDYFALLQQEEFFVQNRNPESVKPNTLAQIRQIIFESLSRNIPKTNGIEFILNRPDDLAGKIKSDGKRLFIDSTVAFVGPVKLGVIEIFQLHKPLLILEPGTKVLVNEPILGVIDQPGTITNIDGESVDVELEDGSRCSINISSIFQIK